MNVATLEYHGKSYRADMSQAIDLSMAIKFDVPQLTAFGAPPARATPLTANTFVGDVNQGGSCNCSTYQLTPHGNGTHTECVGHLTRDAFTVNGIAPTALLFASLISIMPQRMATSFSQQDRVITRESLQQHLQHDQPCNALVIRTLPNSHKLHTDYDIDCPPYFSPDALAWLGSIGIDHLLVDMPSVDRMQDNGLLLAHRAFWGMPPDSTALSQAQRIHATITELIFVPDKVADGNYLLNLQVAPFEADAAPSRPLLYPLLDLPA